MTHGCRSTYLGARCRRTDHDTLVDNGNGVLYEHMDGEGHLWTTGMGVERDVSVDTTTIEKATETRVIEGIRLPWATRALLGRPPEHGEMFVDADTLVALAEQDRWAAQFGQVLTLPYRVGLALAQAGLAEQETRGGYHRTEALVELVRRLGWA